MTWTLPFRLTGKLVAFCGSYTNSASDVFVVPAAGGEERRVIREDAHFRGWPGCPIAIRLIASSNRSGPYGLWKVAVSTGVVTPIPVTATSAREPSVSPDGSRIVYNDNVYQSEIWRTRTNLHEGARVCTLPGSLVAGLAIGYFFRLCLRCWARWRRSSSG